MQTNPISNKQNQTLVLAFAMLLITISYGVRVPVIDNPYFGNHLFRQLQTLSTIEAYLIDGINLLQPRTNYMGYPGNLLLECPLFQATVAFLADLLAKVDPLIVARSINLLLGLISAFFIYKITRRHTCQYGSIIASTIFVLAPLNLSYHISTLVDPTAVLMCLIAIESYFSLKKNLRPHCSFKNCLLIGALLLSCTITVLIKPLYLFPLALLLLTDLAVSSITNRNGSDYLQYIKSRLPIWLPVGVAGVIMLSWLSFSTNHSSAQDVTSHLGWTVLKRPSFYLTIAIRYFFYIQTPITLLLSLLALFEYKRSTTKQSITVVLFFLTPLLYYIAFANINRPHDYYSLILVPFVSITAGIGSGYLLQKYRDSGISNKQVLTSCILVITFLSSQYLYFTNYWLTPNTSNRYAKLDQQASELLEPFNYSLVYVNKNGAFDINEYLGESRRTLIPARLGKLDETKLRKTVRPIWEPCILYALNHQYGEMFWYDTSISVTTLKKRIESYQGNLKYLIIYMAENVEEIEENLAPLDLQLSTHTDDLIIYKLK